MCFSFICIYLIMLSWTAENYTLAPFLHPKNDQINRAATPTVPDNTVGDKGEMEGMVLATQHLRAGALGWNTCIQPQISQSDAPCHRQADLLNALRSSWCENEEGKPMDLFGISCVFWMVAWLFLRSLLTACHKVVFYKRFLASHI